MKYIKKYIIIEKNKRFTRVLEDLDGFPRSISGVGGDVDAVVVDKRILLYSCDVFYCEYKNHDNIFMNEYNK